MSFGKPGTRRLAAILVSDVVGYSRMMEADEAATIAAIRELRESIVDPALDRHNGRLIKVMGDGAIAEFGSVINAVTCAVEVQRETARANADLPEDRQIRLRIGINLGDLVVDGDDLLGDGVNVAARLESIAEPGDIYVARNVANMARDKVPFAFVDLGEKHLKNIAQPVQVFRVDPDGTTAARALPAARLTGRTVRLGTLAAALVVALVAGWTFLQPNPAPAIDASNVLTVKGPAVAALPFANLSGTSEHDNFARGMTQQIAAALTRFKGLRVLSGRASAKYADDLDALRTNLGADYLLEGNVRRSDDRVRVTAVLTDVQTGKQVWTDTFDADLTPANVIDVQDRLAGQVASAIAAGGTSAISLDRHADARGKTTDHLSAFDCVYGATAWNTPAELHARIECGLKAVAVDPDYAQGWAVLSNSYMLDYFFDYRFRNGPDYRPKELALDAALRAVDLAPNSATAHLALANAYYISGRHEDFRREAAIALSLNPNDSSVVAEIGMHLGFAGNWEEGLTLVKKVEKFNPTALQPQNFYVAVKRHYLRGEYEEALKELKKGYFPGSFLDPIVRTYVNAAWGRMDAAEAAAAEVLEMNPGFAIQDFAEMCRRMQFQESYIEKATADLRKAGLPERGEAAASN